jgi:hypothetical protein
MVNWDFDRDKTQFDTLSTKTLGQIRPGWQWAAEFAFCPSRWWHILCDRRYVRVFR